MGGLSGNCSSAASAPLEQRNLSPPSCTQAAAAAAPWRSTACVACTAEVAGYPACSGELPHQAH